MRILSFIACMLVHVLVFSQDMNNEKLYEILKQQTDTITGISGNWKMLHKELPMICVTDQSNNRMRIIAPIIESHKLDKDLLLDSMTANFHSALDVKYAISNGILWSVFIHPLQELSTEQVESAISQVYYAAKTFGTTFSSTELLFGGSQLEEKESEKEQEVLPKQNTGKF